MEKVEQSGQRLGEAIAKYPRTAKLVGWAIVVAIFSFAAFAIWYELSRGHYLKIAIIGSIASYGGFKAYRNSKNAQRNLRAE